MKQLETGLTSQDDWKKNPNSLAIIIASDLLLFPNHSEWVKNGWIGMLDKIEIAGSKLNYEEKNRALFIKDELNKISASSPENLENIKKKFLEEHNKKYPNFPLTIENLSKLPSDPKFLIAKTITLTRSNASDDEIKLADLLYLNGYKDGVLKEKEKTSISPLSDFLKSQIESIDGIFRTVQKREKIILERETFNLMSEENQILGISKKTQNFGIVNEKGERKGGLSEALSNYKDLIVLMSKKEFEKIQNSMEITIENDYLKSFVIPLINHQDRIQMIVIDETAKKMELLTTEKKESPKIFKVITTDSVDEILQYISNIITKKETPQTESSVNVAKSLVCTNQKSRE